MRSGSYRFTNRVPHAVVAFTRSHSRPHVSNDNPYSEAHLSG